jgi:single-strand DNA-binding protein
VAASNINRVIITGNLTKDPELRSSGSGMPICGLRVAVNTRAKDNSTGEWGEKPNYFSVTIFGAQGENCARYLSKGRGVAIDGRLSWREWQDKEGNKRESVEIIADTVQFLSSPEGAGGNGGGFTASRSDVAVNTDDFATAPAGGGGSSGSSAPADDDIPF